MTSFNNWSTNNKALLVAIWLVATVGRVTYVSLNIPDETMTLFVITAAVLAGLGLLLRNFAFKVEQLQAS